MQSLSLSKKTRIVAPISSSSNNSVKVHTATSEPTMERYKVKPISADNIKKQDGSQRDSRESPPLTPTKSIRKQKGRSGSTRNSKKKLPLLWLPWQSPTRSQQNSIEQLDSRLDETAIMDSSVIMTMMGLSFLPKVSTFPLSSFAASAPTTAATCFTPPLSLLHDLPSDLLLDHVLVFAGPQAVSSLAQTSRRMMEQVGGTDSVVWNAMGQAYGKWKSDQVKPIETTWKDLYFRRPLVPVDCGTIQEAFQMATATLEAAATRHAMDRTLAILLRRGTHHVDNPLCIDIDVDLTIAATGATSDNAGHSHTHTPPRIVSSSIDSYNEPLFRVSKGQLTLNGLDLQHASAGVDLWNGNAAVHVQPEGMPSHGDENGAENADGNEAASPTTSAILQGCSLRSTTGRGVSVTGKASVELANCCVHNCAATGIYVAGDDAKVTITQTDVVRNGIGNSMHGGVRRGHSGVYLEAGQVTMQQCSVAQNTATGISVVAGKSLLSLAVCDVMLNERSPLEVPVMEKLRHGIASNNRIAVAGMPRTQSSVLQRAPKVLKAPNEGVPAVPDFVTWIDFLRGDGLL